MVVARGEGKRKMGSKCLMGMEFGFGMMEKFWRYMIVLGVQ